MISPQLLALLRCPTCTSEAGAESARLRLDSETNSLVCGRCGRTYQVHDDEYADLMPQERTGLDHSSKYVSDLAHFEATLDYREPGPPLLGAGVRNRLLRQMLRLNKRDRVLELGTGNAKFLLWNNGLVRQSIGIDPAPLFADKALRELDLVRGDARVLPFPDGAFSKAWSIDVLEHLPPDDIARYLAEAYRVLAPNGRLFVFSNTRERGPFDLLVGGSRRLADLLSKWGVIDRKRDLLRKSDHIKALETWPEVEAAAHAAGFEVQRVVFWNGVFQSFIENILLRLAERAAIAMRGKGTKEVKSSDEGDEAIAARSAVRDRLARGGPMLKVLEALTGLMWLDIVLFGRYRTGPYFVLLHKPQDANSQPRNTSELAKS